MKKVKLLISAVIGLAILFIGLVSFEEYALAEIVRPLILPWVVIYLLWIGRPRDSFFYFILFFALGELLGLTYYLTEVTTLLDDSIYYLANIFFVIAYAFLIKYIFSLIDTKHLLEKLSLYVIILLALDVYCIVIVTNIAFESTQLTGIYDYMLEFSYNTIIMLLLTVAMLNYISKDSKKALLLFLGSLCIVVSEVTQVAYFYVSEMYALQVLYSSLLVAAFALFIRQYRLEHKTTKVFHTIEKVTTSNISRQTELPS